MVLVSNPLIFSILSQTQAAHCPSYLRLDISTARTEDLLVEDIRLLFLLQLL